MNWYVLYTKSRYEKSVAHKLNQSGFEVYCPVLKTKKKWSDRWKWVEEPLFRSYCFVYIEDTDRDKVFSVSGVVRYLYHCGKPAIIRNKEMNQLKNWLMEYDHESIEVKGLNISDKIIFKSGAFIDQKAEVLDSGGNFAILYLESMGLQVKVDLRKNIVEKLNIS
ncbi:MAG: UpxY family transcription antiterminator [Pelobium sp.]